MTNTHVVFLTIVNTNMAKTEFYCSSLSPSHTHIYTLLHTHTHIYTSTHTQYIHPHKLRPNQRTSELSICGFGRMSSCMSVGRSLCLNHTHTHTHSGVFCPIPDCSPVRPHKTSSPMTYPLPLSLSLSLPLPLSLSLSLSLTVSVSSSLTPSLCLSLVRWCRLKSS